MGFSRQEYWSGLPFPSPGDLSDPGIKPRSPAFQEDALPSEPRGKPPPAQCLVQNHDSLLPGRLQGAEDADPPLLPLQQSQTVKPNPSEHHCGGDRLSTFHFWKRVEKEYNKTQDQAKLTVCQLKVFQGTDSSYMCQCNDCAAEEPN